MKHLGLKLVMLSGLCLALTACTQHDFGKPFFDLPTTEIVSPFYAEGKVAGPFDHLDNLPTFSAAELLGADRNGKNYDVAEDVSTDGQYYIFHVITDEGTYEVRSLAAMQLHIKELKVLAALKEQSRSATLAHGVGDTLMAPVKTAMTIVSKPQSAAKYTMNNAGNAVGTVRRMSGDLGHRLKGEDPRHFGHATREQAPFFEKVIGKSKAKREIAHDLHFDPYTHYRPLQDELDELAGYHAVGKFGTRRGFFFVPGVGSLVISGLYLTKPTTSEMPIKSPGELAHFNRDRLLDNGFEKAAVSDFLHNPAYTPTEKHILTDLILELSDLEGADNVLTFVAGIDDRAEALGRLRAMGKIVKLVEKEPPSAEGFLLVDEIVVLDRGEVGFLVIEPYDYLAWTFEKGQIFSKLFQELKRVPKPGQSIYFLSDGILANNSKKAFKTFGVSIKEISDFL